MTWNGKSSDKNNLARGVPEDQAPLELYIWISQRISSQAERQSRLYNTDQLAKRVKAALTCCTYRTASTWYISASRTLSYQHEVNGCWGILANICQSLHGGTCRMTLVWMLPCFAFLIETCFCFAIVIAFYSYRFLEARPASNDISTLPTFWEMCISHFIYPKFIYPNGGGPGGRSPSGKNGGPGGGAPRNFFDP